MILRCFFKPALVCGVLAVGVLVALSAAADTLDKIQEEGRITVGVRDASGAMSYTLGPDKYVGYQVDVCERIVADIKKTLLLDKLEVRYQVVTPTNRIPLLSNGTIQLECGSTTNNTARQTDVAFSPTTYVESVRIAVKADSGIHDFTDLGGKTIVATAGSTAIRVVRNLNRVASRKVLEIYGKDNADGFLLFESGRADAYAADSQILATLISKSKYPGNYKILERPLSVEPIGIMIPKGDTRFKKLVDTTVTALASSGELAQLYDKWFVQPIPPHGTKVGLPASALTRAAWASPNDKPLEAYAEK
ncbi:amino acid ABC transporter substrate-binding protein [Variovorax paradoxus]|uniref:amino acid ABC transporter substrate-binding protein n=1 Tax=Variovorax paradoxus TaxID=34073 RepID=UPI00193438DE|nr:amino acid ABC transporter substrate-binding protein [Variovorax paradoxus]